MIEIDCSKKRVQTRLLWVGLQLSAAFAEHLRRAWRQEKEGCLYIRSPAEFCLSLIPDDSGAE